jgi:hypothetical protein
MDEAEGHVEEYASVCQTQASYFGGGSGQNQSGSMSTMGEGQGGEGDVRYNRAPPGR